MEFLCVEPSKTNDYHEKMNGEVYETWFSDILDPLEEGSVIVQDQRGWEVIVSWRRYAGQDPLQCRMRPYTKHMFQQSENH